MILNMANSPSPQSFFDLPLRDASMIFSKPLEGLTDLKRECRKQEHFANFLEIARAICVENLLRERFLGRLGFMEIMAKPILDTDF